MITEAEYEEYLAVAEQLIAKKDNRTPKETALFRLLVKFDIKDRVKQIIKIASNNQITRLFSL